MILDVVIQATRAALGHGDTQVSEVSVDHLAVCGAHAVLPLVARITDCPAFRAAAKVNGVEVLQKVAQLCGISAALTAAGIEHLALKGPALALQGYGDLSLRQFSDLDLLVRWADLPAADALIRAHGGQPQESLDHLILAAANGLRARTIGLTYRGTGLAPIDLHTGLSHRLGFVLDHEALFARATTVTFGARTVPTLNREDATLFAALHGIQHGWGRLGWVVDAGMLLGHPDLNTGVLMARAADQGCSRVLGLAAALARDTLGFTLPDALNDMADGRDVQRLVPQARALLDADGPVVNKGAQQLLRLQLGTWDRPLMVARHTLATLVTPTEPDYAHIVLPRSLFWLYPIVRAWRVLVAGRTNVLGGFHD